MDLSGFIFVALALGWAVYLVPRALQSSEESSVARSVSSFSDRMRVFSGRPAQSQQPDHPERTAAPQRSAAPRPLPTRASARRAAARRRRVLGGLLLLSVLVGGLAAASVLPWWSLALPLGAVVVFLATARAAVRRQHAAQRPLPAPVVEEDTTEVARVRAPGDEPGTETPGVRPVSADAEEALARASALWDPLPLTLPTYVGKPAARRTVRTIALTGMSSSGHDAADSALAQQADAERRRVQEQAAERLAQ